MCVRLLSLFSEITFNVSLTDSLYSEMKTHNHRKRLYEMQLIDRVYINGPPKIALSILPIISRSPYNNSRITIIDPLLFWEKKGKTFRNLPVEFIYIYMYIYKKGERSFFQINAGIKILRSYLFNYIYI